MGLSKLNKKGVFFTFIALTTIALSKPMQAHERHWFDGNVNG